MPRPSPPTKVLTCVLTLCVIAACAYGISRVISRNTVSHPDCLSGYRVVDC